MKETKSEELERLKQRIDQLETEQEPAQEIQIIEPPLTMPPVLVVPSENKTVVFLKEYLIPFVRRQWKLLIVATVCLTVAIWLIVSVGLVGTVVILVVLAVIAFAVNQETKSEAYKETKRVNRKRHSRERKVLWLELNDRQGRGKVTCTYCRKKMPRLDKTVHLDHIKPKSKEGTNELKNMQLICANCNERKGTMDHEDFKNIVRREQQKKARARNKRY